MLTSSIKLKRNAKKRKGGELAGGLPAYKRPTFTKRRHVPGAELIAFFGNYLESRRPKRAPKPCCENYLKRLLWSKGTKIQLVILKALIGAISCSAG